MPEQHHKVTPADDVVDPTNTPYGPHHGHVDEAAGGADSSPFETEPTGRRLDEAGGRTGPGEGAGDQPGGR